MIQQFSGVSLNITQQCCCFVCVCLHFAFVILCFQNLIQAHPYHIDSLMQMSEIFRMSEDMQTAAQFIGNSLGFCLFVYLSVCISVCQS